MRHIKRTEKISRGDAIEGTKGKSYYEGDLSLTKWQKLNGDNERVFVAVS